MDAESAKEVAEGKTVGVIQVNEAEVKAHLGERVRQSVEETLNGMLDACPDAEWRLIFALARLGGLRVPLEILGLTWGDIHWAEGRFTVHSPKTEHHPGQESRLAPLVPELLPYLREALERAEPGTGHVITRCRLANQNLQTQLRRILRRAGIKPWPKLYQNLRSTRQAELTDRFPVHVVCAWFGNRAPVVMKHCLQMTDERFRQVAQKAVQKAVQPPSAATCRNPPAEPGPKEETAIVASGQQVADTGNDLSTELVGAGGLEPPTSSL